MKSIIYNATPSRYERCIPCLLFDFCGPASRDPQGSCTQLVTVQEALSSRVRSKAAHRHSFMTFTCRTAYTLHACIERREEANKHLAHDEECHVSIVPREGLQHPSPAASKFSERSQTFGERSEFVQRRWGWVERRPGGKMVIAVSRSGHRASTRKREKQESNGLPCSSLSLLPSPSSPPWPLPRRPI